MAVVLFSVSTAAAQDATADESPPEVSLADRFTLSGLIAGSYQFQRVSGADEDGGALLIRPSLDFALTDVDHFHLTFALAGSNGVNDVSPFQLAPWAADLEDDLEDINGSGRDYLQTAWYRRTFALGEDHELAITGGVIDSTEYLDGNAFANDEYTQFMNQALVNGPGAFSPSYDFGGAVEWSCGPWEAAGVVMRVSENDDGESFIFAGAQIGYRVETGLGEGNYRFNVAYGSDDFDDPDGTSTESRWSGILSVDQRLGSVFGVWARAGYQDDAARVPYSTLVSGGVDVNGRWWGREQDNIGVGVAFLDGGNTDLDDSQVFEAYIRFALTDALAVTLDAQYLRDTYAGEDTVDGWVLGGRFVYEF